MEFITLFGDVSRELVGTSLQTRTVPKTTWRPSKKLSPMTMTVAPPDVQPSLGQTALMVGVTDERKPAFKQVSDHCLLYAVYRRQWSDSVTATSATWPSSIVVSVELTRCKMPGFENRLAYSKGKFGQESSKGPV